MNIQCLKCKGRNLCSRPVCPIQAKISSQKKVNFSSKQDFFGESPNIFVGKFGYPDVNVGMLGVEDYTTHDAPLEWSKEEYNINQIVDLRSQLINSRFKANIKDFNQRFLEMSQEISMASSPVDIEINLEKKPEFKMSFNQDITPHGPSVKLKKAELTENPKIPKKVDYVVSDADLKANDALNILTEKNFDEHYLTKLLSVGNLGVKKQRKLVPTRWAITAVDDNVGKHIIREIRDYNHIDYHAYFGGYLGNYFLVLFFPEIWSYELFETYVGENKAIFATDYEFHNGRKEYAHNTAGGYYAARLPVLQKLSELKRQGSCLCLRFITDEYWAPLGVWVVREATRKSLTSRPIEFGSKELMLKYAEHFVKKKFGYDLSHILKNSVLLKHMKTQIKLNSFF